MTIFNIHRHVPSSHGLVPQPAAPAPATAPAVTGRQWPGRKSPVPASLAAGVPAEAGGGRPRR